MVILYIIIGLIYHFATENQLQANVRKTDAFMYLSILVIDVLFWWCIILYFEIRKRI